ncbi:MAG: hypothetical protein ABEJ05_07780 [Haloglomus sp.]
MQPVEDADGRRYLLVKRSGESSLVRDPATGREEYHPNDDLTPVEASGLELAAEAVSAPVRRVLTAVHDDRSLGLLFALDARGPTAVRTLLDRTELCESDLHGLLGEFRAAGLVTETDVAGERGYRTTDRASEALDQLRTPDDEET